MASSASAYTEVPRPQNDKYLFATMSTVYSFSISGKSISYLHFDLTGLSGCREQVSLKMI